MEQMLNFAVATWIGAAVDALGRLDHEREQANDRDDLTELAHLLGAFQEIADNALAALTSTETAIGNLMRDLGERRLVIEGVGTIERSGRSYDHYDSGALLRQVVRRAFTDPDTGVIGDDAAMTRVMHVLSQCLPITGSLQWRTTGCARFGIDATEYRERAWGADRV